MNLEKKNFKISIVTPVYNCEGYLNEFFDSVLNQTYKGFFLYVVNDCSTDRTREIIKQYEDRFEGRLIYLESKENSGQSVSRNIALDEIAKWPTEYLTFLDADDWIEEDYLKDLYDAAIKEDADLTISGLHRFDDETGKEICVEMISFPENKITKLYEFDGFGRMNTCLYCKLFRYEKVKDVRFRVMGRSEDTCYVFETLPLMGSAKFTNHAYYHYRVRKSSLSGFGNDNISKSMYEQFGNMLKKYENEPYKDFIDLLETQIFIRSAVGGVCRDSFKSMKKAKKYENICRRFMDENMPSWRKNPYLSLRKGLSGGMKANALKVCTLLYKMHMFILFVWAYYFMSQVLKKDVRA